MPELITIESLCRGLNGFQSREEINKTVNSIHFQLTKYFLSVDNVIEEVPYEDFKRLKEIALYLFDILIDNLFIEDIEPESRKTMSMLCQNIFEQLCKVYKNNYEENKNEYLELTFMAISCSSISNNPAKAYVLFGKYLDESIIAHSLEDKIFILLNAYMAKNYKYIEKNIKDFKESLEEGYENVYTNKIMIEITLHVLEMINYFKTGEEDIVERVIANLDKLKRYSLENNYYKEIWIIKVLIKHIELSYINSTWRVLNNCLSSNSIRLLVEDNEKPLYELWDHQRQIIERLLFTNENCIINIPTSAGKSLIAQLSIIKILEECADATCIYVVPTNALLNQVKDDLNRILSKMNYNIGTLISGYEIINTEYEKSKLNSSRVIIVTQEKLDNLIRRDDKFIEKCKLFIFDEFQNIAQGARGLLLEFVVSKIKYYNIGQQPKLLFLSAVLPNILSFKKWIGEDITFEYSNFDCRPTRQVKSIGYYEDILCDGQTSKYLETVQSKLKIYYDDNKAGIITFPTMKMNLSNKAKHYKLQNYCADLAERFSKIGNVLVYLPDTRWFRSFCDAMCEKELPLQEREIKILNEVADYIALTLNEDHYLVKSIRKGIACHYKKLPDNVKRIIEIYFKRGYIKVLASTSTLAQGLNFPISTIIVGSLNAGDIRITPADFQNLIGRAGRAMRETEGYIVLALQVKHDIASIITQNYINKMNKNYLNNNYNDLIINSTVYNLINALEKQETDLDNYESELIRTYNSIIFDLEQNGSLNDEESYDNLINSLFFSVDAIDEKKDILKLYTKEMVAAIKSKISNVDDIVIRKILKQSGLSIDSSIIIYEAVCNFCKNNISYVFENNKLNRNFIDLINIVKDIPEFCTNEDGEFIYNCINSWISLSSYKEICEDYFNGNYDKCIKFINENIIYKFAWLFSVIFQVYERLSIKNVTVLTLSNNLIKLLMDFSFLPAYFKFGISNKSMIDIMENGLNDRELLIKANRIFELHTNSFLNNSQVFYLWASSITLKDIDIENIKISNQEKKFWRTFRNSLPDDINIEYEIKSASIKGYGMYEKKYILNGEPLILRDESDNKYDPNAIEIFSIDNKKLGYIPKELTEIVHNKEISWIVFDKFDGDEFLFNLYLI